ncbi:MAG: replication initiation protein [Rhodanobacteraceae bacterium]|nr:replication initiation protein [Rhodanobacteraceae bacterium]
MKPGSALLVTKANAIVEASYRLTLQEQRLVLFCVAQVDSRRPLEEQRTFTVEATPFRETFDLSPEKVYEELKDAAVRLFERKVTISDAQNGQETLLRWVSMIRYQNRRGRVVLNFAPEMLPFISALKDRFTSYPLESIARLSSTFAIRLFEVLAQYANLGRRQVSVEQLRRWLDCVDSYPRFSEFERWVVAPAVAQLNERTELRVRYDKSKVGRQVSHFEFVIGRAPSAPKPKSVAVPKPATAAPDERQAREREEWEAHMRRLGLDPAELLAQAGRPPGRDDDQSR